MAYSSWTSDLKTRLSVGFLGKVVNLLVQAKDRIDLLHTAVTVTSDVQYSYENLGVGVTSAAASTTVPLSSLWNTYAGTTTITLADGTYDGQYKKFTYSYKTASNVVELKTASTANYNILDFGELPTVALTNNKITFDSEGDFVELMWSTQVTGAGSHTGPAWVIVGKDGVAVGTW